MKRNISSLTAVTVMAAILCGCASSEPHNGAAEERTDTSAAVSVAKDTEKAQSADEQTGEFDIDSLLTKEVTVTSAENFAPSLPTGESISEDPYAAGLTVGDVLAHNSYGELLGRYSSIKSEYAYKSTQSVDVVNVYTYFERNSDSCNVIDYMGEQYIMVFCNGMTYLKCIIDGQTQYYNIFTFSKDYYSLVAKKYLNSNYAESYDAAKITRYAANGGEYEFAVDFDASDEFINANADFYNVSKGDIVRERYRTDSQLNLKSTSMTIIHSDKSEEAILSRKLLYNVKMDMPDFVDKLASPSDPVNVTFILSPGTANEQSETITVQKGTYLGTHFDSSLIYSDKKCIQNADFAGKPIEFDMTLYVRDNKQ